MQALNILWVCVSVKFRGADYFRFSERMSRLFAFRRTGFRCGSYDTLKRLSFCFHPDMEIVSEDFFRDVPDNLADRLFSGSILGKLGDQRMAMVMPTACDVGIFPNVLPSCLD
ncbi:MAG: hypothetical protein ABSD67_25965, partial [Terracidiphilus sp.]